MKGDKESIVWKYGFGQIPILEHNGFQLAQSQAIHQYCAELALGAKDFTSQERAIDYMFLGTHEDLHAEMYKTFKGTIDETKKLLADFPDVATRYLTGLE